METKNIPKYLWIGRGDKDWYEDASKTFIDLYGVEELPLVCQLFAATSINSSLKSNIQLFRRAYHEYKTGKPFSRYLPNMKLQLERIRNGEEISGRKINNFAKAMSGDPQAVVVDIWILRAFGYDNKWMRKTGQHAGKMREGGATKKQYDLIEAYIQSEAKEMGLEPRQMCAMIWGGIRTHQTGDKQTRYTVILKNHFNNLFTEYEQARSSDTTRVSEGVRQGG